MNGLNNALSFVKNVSEFFFMSSATSLKSCSTPLMMSPPSLTARPAFVSFRNLSATTGATLLTPVISIESFSTFVAPFSGAVYQCVLGTVVGVVVGDPPVVVGVVPFPPNSCLNPHTILPMFEATSNSFSPANANPMPSSAFMMLSLFFLIHSKPSLTRFSPSPTALTAVFRSVLLISVKKAVIASCRLFISSFPSSVCRYALNSDIRSVRLFASTSNAGASSLSTFIFSAWNWSSSSCS